MLVILNNGGISIIFLRLFPLLYFVQNDKYSSCQI